MAHTKKRRQHFHIENFDVVPRVRMCIYIHVCVYVHTVYAHTHMYDCLSMRIYVWASV